MIGAAYAMSKYGPGYGPTQPSSSSDMPAIIQKVAIIDFDIHHGNGSEDIIRGLLPHTENYPLPSSWAPMSYTAYKPFRDTNDRENIFFSSIHLYDGEEFYPGGGKGPCGDTVELSSNPNVINVPLEMLGPKYIEQRSKLSVKVRKTYMQEASRIFRHNVATKVLPALRTFAPDLILLSSGFDGHADDFYYYLTEDDYEWITNEIQAIADESADGRLISVLEGGYAISTAAPLIQRRKSSNTSLAAEIHKRPVRTVDSTYGALARSVAAHVDALIGKT